MTHATNVIPTADTPQPGAQHDPTRAEATKKPLDPITLDCLALWFIKTGRRLGLLEEAR